MQGPRISVCLPVLNGAADLERLLPVLAAQVGVGEIEIVAIDSSSTDASVDLLQAAGARVTVIPRSAFRHGPTRNRLAEMAAGELCVFLSQDALPADEHFLAKLTGPLQAGLGAGGDSSGSDSAARPRISGATARVLPHPADDPLTARTVLDAPEAASKSEVRRLPAGARLADLAPEERDALVRFNDVASAIRREVLLELPFPDVPFAEDAAWAALALDAGHALAFVAEAVALHAHRYGPRTAFERYRVDAAWQRRAHGVRVRPGLVSVLRGFLFELRADVRHVSGQGAGWLHLARAPFLRGGQVLGQWFGSRGWVLPGTKRSATDRYS